MKIESHSCDGDCLLCRLGVPRVVAGSLPVALPGHCMRGACTGLFGTCDCACKSCRAAILSEAGPR